MSELIMLYPVFKSLFSWESSNSENNLTPNTKIAIYTPKRKLLLDFFI